MEEIHIEEKVVNVDTVSCKIDLDLIYMQNYIVNRKDNNDFKSYDLLELGRSIRNTNGLIHPVVVRADGEGKYELFVGHRRYDAYKMLTGRYKEYKSIPANVYPKETKTKEMLMLTIHENARRKNLDKSENIESKISLLPVFLEIQCEGKSTLSFGFEILKVYNSYLRSQDHKTKYSDKMKNITGLENPIAKMHEFFEIIGMVPKTFFLSARVYFGCSNDITKLFREGKISNRHALALESMKIEKDKMVLIKNLQNKEIIPYRELENYIRDSNAKGSPKKQKSKLIQGFNHIIVQLSSKNQIIDDQQNNLIQMYIEKIENILEKS